MLFFFLSVCKGTAGLSPAEGKTPKSSGENPSHVLRVLTWNVENLFDTRDDADKTDEEFLPEGSYRWTPGRYWHKLRELSKVIAYAAEGRIPALIGLCEVENDSVLTDLTLRSPLRAMNYRFVMTSSPDRRGIDVALLYQPSQFQLLHQRSIRIPEGEMGPTRDILHVTGLTSKTDTLHVFVCHLPSRKGGAHGSKHRALAASTLWDAIRPLLNRPHSRVIAMGDFNAATSDRIFRSSPLRLTDDRKSRPAGTYCFRGKWQYLDHILVSPSFQPCKAVPLHPKWLLEQDRTYGGTKPRRTYQGNHYHAGISDHLPLMLDLVLNKK